MRPSGCPVQAAWGGVVIYHCRRRIYHDMLRALQIVKVTCTCPFQVHTIGTPIIGILLLALTTGLAAADEIRMENGDRLTGEIQ
jgi:uncharacterized membrane protein